MFVFIRKTALVLKNILKFLKWKYIAFEYLFIINDQFMDFNLNDYYDDFLLKNLPTTKFYLFHLKK